MKKSLSIPISLAVLAALTLTGLAAAEKLTGYKHRKGVDLQGYYMPMKEVRVGNFVLDHIYVGTDEELSTFEKTGKSASPVFAPFMFQFNDVTSPTGENELGQTYYQVTERVLPNAYRLTAAEVSFAGDGEKLGEIVFAGAPNLKEIKKAKESIGRAGEGPALTGTLTIGETVIENVSLTWFGGD